MVSAARIVLSRWAMTMLLRPRMIWLSASWISASDWLSKWLGRFIKHENARVFQDDAGDRHTLLFTAAEPVTALADDRVIAIAQSHDEVMNMRDLRRRFKFGLRRVRLGIEQVCTDRIME